jgi:hypothetical protein
MKMLKIAGLAAIIGLTGVAVANAFTLTSGNTVVTYDPDTQAGMSSWTVDGVNQLAKQWFWYRVGATGGESALNTLSHTTTTGTFGGAALVESVFTSPGNFSITITYTIKGGTVGSKKSDIAEVISIENLSGSALPIHFFQYSDFDLGGTANNDSGWMANPNTIDQSDLSTALSETVATPGANEYQVGIGTAAGLMASLNDALPTTLSDTPLIGIANKIGPTNVAWAFQWDFNIAGNDSALISKDKQISPTPDVGSTLALLGAALTGLAFVGRRFGRR